MMAQLLHQDSLWDMFNPAKHPRDGNGRFAKSWSSKAIAGGVDAEIAKSLSTESRSHLAVVHRAAEARRLARTEALKVKANPGATSRDRANAQMKVSFADATLYDLIGSMAQPRERDLFDGPQVNEMRAVAPGTTTTQRQYVAEMTAAMSDFRNKLMGTPNKWAEDGGKSGMVSINYARGISRDEGYKAVLQVQKAYQDMLKLTGFQFDDFQIFYNKDQSIMSGSLYDPRTRTLELDPAKSMETELFHEFAHAVETDNPEIVEAEKKWLKGRSHDGEVHEIGGDRHLVGYEDGYIDRYVGRTYPKEKPIDPDDEDADLLADLLDDLDDRSPIQKVKEEGIGHTEALSVGLEYFATPFGMAKLYSADPDHFNFVVEQIVAAKKAPNRRTNRGDSGDRQDYGPDVDPLVPLFASILTKVDPTVITEGWHPEEIKQEGRAVVDLLLQQFRESMPVRLDAVGVPLPHQNIVASYLSSFLIQVEPMIDLAGWDAEAIIQEGQSVLDFLIDDFCQQQAIALMSEPVVATVPKAEVFYMPENGDPAATCASCFAYIPGGGCEIVQGAISPTGTCDLWEPVTPPPLRQDDNQRVQKVLKWRGLELGIQYLPGDMRHNRRLTAAYGHVRGTYGQSDDGMALDVWVNLEGADSDRIFKLQQLTQEGEHDEDKYILGVSSVAEAEALYIANMPRKLMGKVEECAIDELKPKADAESIPDEEFPSRSDAIEFFSPGRLRTAKSGVSYLRGYSQPFVLTIEGKPYIYKKSRGAVPEAVGCAIARIGEVPHVHSQLIAGTGNPLEKRELISEKIDGVQDVKSFDTVARQLGDIHSHWDLLGENSVPKATALKAFANMLKHPDLAKISALDIFTGNTDRTTSNMLYDPQTGGFIGVDIEYAYDSILRPATVYALGEELPSQGKGFVFRNENVAKLLTGSSDEELDQHLTATNIDIFVLTLEALHRKLDAPAITDLFSEALGNVEAEATIAPGVEKVYKASSRILARLKAYQKWRAAQGDRADGFFNWSEAKHERDANGRFAAKPSAKTRITYAGDEKLTAKVQEIAEEIASVHTLPSIVSPELQSARVVVSASPHSLDNSIGGQYDPQYRNMIELWTPPDNFTKGNTFTHEYGHHIDSMLDMGKRVRPHSFASFKTGYAAEYLEMFGDNVDPIIKRYLEEDVAVIGSQYTAASTIKEIASYNPEAAMHYQFVSDSHLAVERIMGRARNTKELSQLRDIATAGYVELPNGLRKEADRNYVQYLLNPTEVFARGYNQWISTRGLSETTPPDNPRSFEAFAETLVLGSKVYPSTWSEASFHDIHNGFEDGFSELGLIKGAAKYRL